MIGGTHMIDISLNLYKIFYITAQSKTIVEAAEKLYISQPSISKSIKKLEDTLGVVLFYRTKKGVELTEEGRNVFEYVDKCYNHLVAGQKMITDYKSFENGSISIGVPSHIACFFVVDIIKKFKIKYPNIRFEIVSSSTNKLTELLYNHKIDIILDSPPIDIIENVIVEKKVCNFDMIFIANKNFDYKNFDILSKNGYKFILPNKSTSVYTRLNKTLLEKNIQINLDIEANTTDVIISCVKNDLGIGYVVKKSVEKELDNGELIELETPFKLPKLELNLVYMKNYLTCATKEFIREILPDFNI